MKIFKLNNLAYVLVVLFVMASCQKEAVLETPTVALKSKICETKPIDVDGKELQEGVRKELFALGDMLRHKEITNESEALAYYLGETEMKKEMEKELTANMIQYKEKGFEGYVAAKTSEGLISSQQQQFLLELKKNYLALLEKLPSLETNLAFWEEQGKNVENSSKFCEVEKRMLYAYFSSAKGFVEYFYALNPTGQNLTGIMDRTCDSFWETLGCGAFGVLVGTVVAVTVTVLVVALAGNCTIDGQPAPCQLLGFIAGVLVGIHLGVASYDWCCTWNDVDLDCRAVQNLHPIFAKCNEFIIRAFGAGDDATGFAWSGTNASFASTMTIEPEVRITVPDLDESTTVNVIASCSDGTTLATYSETFELSNLTGSAPPPLAWGYEPPDGANQFDEIEVAVVTGSTEQYELSWSVSTGGSITPTGPFSANVLFWNTGSITITATLTNTCTGETSSISKTVEVK